MNHAIFEAFYGIVRQIPVGKVATYGQIAKLAGMPQSIVKRADEVLLQLESANRKDNITKDLGAVANQCGGMQLSFFQLDDPVLSQVRDEIRDLDINNLTPMAALNKLHDIRKIITGKD